jgi:hypothetical protein
MIVLKFFILSQIFSFVFASIIRETDKTKEDEIDKPVQGSQCGEVLAGTRGTIKYYLDVYYRANERCIWTIRLPKTSTVKFTLTQSGLHYSDTIYITTFQKGFLFSENHLNETGSSVSLVGDVAFVIFGSNSEYQGYGFSLDFTTKTANPPNLISTRSQDHIIRTKSSGRNTVLHPNDGLGYSKNELSTMVITYADFIKTNENIWLWKAKILSQQTTCGDSMKVYKFELGYNGQAPKLTLSKSICEELGSPWIVYSDMFIIIFEGNDDDIVGGGFSIEYERTRS